MNEILSSPEWLALGAHMVPAVGVLLLVSAALLAWEIHLSLIHI